MACQSLVQRVPVTRITIGASAAATCFATVVAANALSSGPTLQQRELLRKCWPAMGDPPGPTVPPYAARRRLARRLSVHSGR